MRHEEEQKYLQSVIDYGNKRYKEGARAVLIDLETFAGWLSMRPDTKRQKMQREWCEKRIREIKERLGI